MKKHLSLPHHKLRIHEGDTISHSQPQFKFKQNSAFNFNVREECTIRSLQNVNWENKNGSFQTEREKDNENQETGGN